MVKKKLLAAALLIALLMPAKVEAVETVPRCEVVINPVHVTNNDAFGPLITVNGAVNCNVPMLTFNMISSIRQYKMGVLTTVSSRSYSYSGSVHKYFQWYAGPCILAYEAPIFVHTVNATGTTVTGVILSPASGSSDAAQLAGCQGLI